MNIIREGYTVLMETFSTPEFGSFCEDTEGKRTVEIYDNVHDAHLDMLDHYKSCVEAVKEGHMEDFSYDCSVAFVQEFEDGSIVAFDEHGNNICETSKSDLQ